MAEKAYCRMKDIDAVCSNDEARQYFKGKGLTYSDVSEGDILALVMLLNKHLKKANKDFRRQLRSVGERRNYEISEETGSDRGIPV